MGQMRDDIVLYNYGFSPFGKRVSAYLALRGIPYSLCEQPFTMPRPDLALLPVHYRRIPILAIGSDIYLDTRLILSKLECLPHVPTPKLGGSSPSDSLIEELLERFMIEGPVFSMAAGLVDPNVASDPTFNKDRQGMLGRTWSKEELDEGRGECLNYVRNLYHMMESTILRDGREWILGKDGPGLADIQAVFLLDFVSDMNLAEEIISKELFPRTFAWIARYRAAVEKAKGAAPEPTKLEGQAAADGIFRSEATDPQVVVDKADPTGLAEGTEVEIYAADWGTEHRDRGRLIGLTQDEVTIAVKSKGNVEIRVHAPRTGFKINEIGQN